MHGITPARQRGLFDSCLARRDVAAAYGRCPLCGGPPELHDLEPGPVPDDAGFDEWLCNLPRSPQ